MASGAQVTLRGRFSPGTQVKLVKVDGPHVLRPGANDEEIATKTVDDDGTVQFTRGVEQDARYFIVGQQGGFPLEVRARGRAADDIDTILAVAPPAPDRLRLSDGSWLDEAPKREKTPGGEVGPGPSQQQVPAGTVQRTDTPCGSAHPVDTDEPTPYRAQEDVPEGTVQASDTPTGRATEILVGPQRQEDVPKGTVQRSDTPTGVAYPIVKGNAVEAQQIKESSAGKESRGEPVRVAAEPLDRAKAPKGATSKQSDKRAEELAESEDQAPEATADADAKSDAIAAAAPGDRKPARQAARKPRKK